MAHKRISIITITYNNLSGLRKTAESVARQSYRDFEWVIVDGDSTDGTKAYLEALRKNGACFVGGKVNSASAVSGESCACPVDMDTQCLPEEIRIVSEPDKGVYDAQNKGIRLATGDYCFFLNAGDCFCGAEVLALMFGAMEGKEDYERVCGCGKSGEGIGSVRGESGTGLPIVYGNEVVVDAAGKRVDYCRGVENPGFVDLYNSCMKHQATFIPRALFAQYGDYDISLRICADWEWFFRVIAFHDEVHLVYKDVDVSLFENTGLSYHNPDLCRHERQQVLDRYMSQRLQRDYAVLGRYVHITKLQEQRIPTLLLRIANRLLK